MYVIYTGKTFLQFPCIGVFLSLVFNWRRMDGTSMPAAVRFWFTYYSRSSDQVCQLKFVV